MVKSRLRKKRRKVKAKVGRRAKVISFKSHKDLPYCAMSLSNTLYNKAGEWRSIKPIIDKKKCISCLICWKFCPDACISVKNGIPVINYDYCKGCGICIEVCPKGAIIAEKEAR